MTALLGTWGRPPDALSKVAIGTAIALAVLAASGRGRTVLANDDIPRRHFLAAAAFVASLLSLYWIATYLRGGPRIVDATTYFLQGRALAQGDLAWKLPDDLPSASFRGRFLLHHDGDLGGIFPPGYPLLLAIGFTFGAPMIVGPLLAAAIVVATYHLARAVAEEVVAGDAALIEHVARGAALLSITSAALRYHTADTMSHGATALGITVSLTFALRRRAALAGLALGFVLATRPISAIAIGVVAIVLVGRRGALRLAIGAIPGVLLLLASQRALTGSFFTSTQRAYYAGSDGPPGCFRWGFGDGVGCLGEHGEFVRARLANGYGLAAAIGTTLRRLRMHLTDVANLEPLALLVLVPFAKKRRARAIVAASSVVVLHFLAYAPFYFDGNYPGGGARFFADVLPIEHALVVVGLALFAGARARHHDRVFRRVLFAVLALALAGFGVHAAYDHHKLADRDGGRPMFEPDLLARSNALEGLVYVDTDHGFALGYDPGARTKDGIVVVRLRGDDRDRLVFDRLDRPPTWLYRRDETGPVLQPWAPPDLGRPLRFEAEAEWPPLHQEGGLVLPVQVDACASNSRALAIAPIPQDGTARARVAVPVPESGKYSVVLRVFRGAVVPHAEGVLDPKLRGFGVARLGPARWEWPDEASGCSDLAEKDVELAAPSATLEIEAIGGLVALDRVTLQKAP